MDNRLIPSSQQPVINQQMGQEDFNQFCPPIILGRSPIRLCLECLTEQLCRSKGTAMFKPPLRLPSKPKPSFLESLGNAWRILVTESRPRRLIHEDEGVKGPLWFGRNPDSPCMSPPTFFGSSVLSSLHRSTSSFPSANGHGKI